MKSNPFKTMSRRDYLLAEYGLTEEAYVALEQAQNHKCKICLKDKEQEPRPLAVDHDHKTGEIRGLLCNSCNRMLGFAKDNQTTLLRAIQYLKRRL